MLEELIKNPLLLIASCIIMGQFSGSIEIKRIKLGSSATLFIGLIMSYLLKTYLGTDIIIPKILFLLSLIGFIVSVGLIASGNIKTILKNYGLKFLILSLVITATGALSTYFFINLMSNIKADVIGTYVGSLTSSPGLATALEIAKNMTTDQSSNIGLGYSIAYMPGILIVIIFAQLTGRKNNSQIIEKKVEVSEENQKGFDLKGFTLIIMFGIVLGSMKLKVSDTATFSLGMTGGTLISALLLGSLKKIGKVNFEFDSKQLGIIRDISLNIFLAIVGLNYGYEAVHAVQQSGLELLLIGFSTGTLSITAGYLVGRYILKIKHTYLVGGICGGMTSTPGLATAIDTFKNEDVVIGYGATYPFALIFMILFTNLLFIKG